MGAVLGQVIGQYRIVRQLGQGGMGTVFEGVHEQLARRAAIKTLHPEVAQDREIAQRFFDEARVANLIRHRGIIDIYDFGRTEEGTTYIVMEYLEGETLGARMERLGGLQIVDALRLVRQIASALRAAHEKGIVHRDLKPENVMIVPDPEVPAGERVVVLDFGVAKLAEEHRAPAGLARTRTGATIGTPVYMSPEQGRGARHAGAMTDVYSLGVMLYEMLAGRPPFLAETATALIAQHMYEDPPPLRDHAPAASAELTALVHRMLDKDPAGRPALHEVISGLEEMGAPRATSPIPALPPPGQDARPRRPFLWAGALLTGTALLGLSAMVARTGWREDSSAPRARSEEVTRSGAGTSAPPAADMHQAPRPGGGAPRVISQEEGTPPPARQIPGREGARGARSRLPADMAPRPGPAPRPAPEQQEGAAAPLSVRLLISRPRDSQVTVSCAGSADRICAQGCLLSVPAGAQCIVHLFGFVDQTFTYGGLQAIRPDADGARTLAVSLDPAEQLLERPAGDPR